jgi:hypothetical protein
MNTMTKEQYINEIVNLLEQCNEEKIWYYIMTFMKEMI